MADSGVHSDPKTVAHRLQTAVGVAANGVIGSKTRVMLDSTDQGKLHNKVLADRLRHLERLITNDPEQSVFAAG